MLLVGERRYGDAGETALPARVTAVASDLLGKRQQLEMREVRSGDPGSGPGQGFIDYVGTARVIAPDTLHFDVRVVPEGGTARSEEHTSELQSLMRISYAVFCLKKKKKTT